MNLNDPITKRNTGETIVRRVPDWRIPVESQAALTADQHTLLKARAKRARRSAVLAVARVGEDHLGGALEVIDPLELVFSVMNRDQGDDFFIAQGHVAAGYYAVLSQHGYLDPKDFEEGFRTSEPIGGHVTPLAGGTMNTGRLGDEGGGVGMALANQVVSGREKAIVYLFTSDGSMQEGSASEAMEIAANRRLNVIFLPALNAMQLSGTTASVDPKGNPAAKARAAGLEVLDTPSMHDFESLYRTLHKAVTLCREGKGPVFINPTGTTKKAKAVFADPAKWGASADEDVWVPGSIMGKGIAHWEEGIIATLHAEKKGKPLEKPVNYHDGNLKKENVDQILPALALTDAEQAALDKALSGKNREEKFVARPKWNASTGYAFEFPKPFPVSKSSRLTNGNHGEDWLSPRKGVNVALKELGAKNKDYLAAVDMDLGGSTQLGVLEGALGPRFLQAGIRERAGILCAAGAAYELLRANAGKNGKIPTTCTGTFAAFLQGVGREGLEFADYQQDIWGYDEGGLTTGVPVKVISSHNGLNPGKDGITAHALHSVDMAYELPRMRRAFVPADANHAIHIIRELFAKADFAMYMGPRDVTPVIQNPEKPGEPLFGPDWKWEPVTAIEKKKDAKAALVVTGPILYRALMAADELAGKNIPADVYFVGQIKPFPVQEIRVILGRYDRIVSIEDGFVGDEDSARGLAGLIAGCLAQGLSGIAGKRGGSLPRLGKIGSRRGQTMSQDPLAIYDSYGLAVSDITRAVESLA